MIRPTSDRAELSQSTIGYIESNRTKTVGHTELDQSTIGGQVELNRANYLPARTEGRHKALKDVTDRYA